MSQSNPSGRYFGILLHYVTPIDRKVHGRVSHLASRPAVFEDGAILIELKEWLSTTQFEERGDEWELCTDSELPKKWKLLKKMDLAQKVQRLAVEIKESANTCLVHRTRILEYQVPDLRDSRIQAAPST